MLRKYVESYVYTFFYIICKNASNYFISKIFWFNILKTEQFSGRLIENLDNFKVFP